jgi:ABC-type multidrug transport system fused ATPase/permease subunit
MKKAAISALIICVLVLFALGVSSSICFIKGTSTMFADTVAFVMMLVGLLVALASLGIWTALRRVLAEDIKKVISEAEEAARNQALSRMFSQVGQAFWAFYIDKGNEVFLNESIRADRQAYNVIEGKQRIYGEDELKCLVYNNLAFAYAERGDPKDTVMAHRLANYVKERATDFPDYETMWLDTYAYVLYKLPKNKLEDRRLARKIVNNLLVRPDLLVSEKEEIRQRYKKTP